MTRATAQNPDKPLAVGPHLDWSLTGLAFHHPATILPRHVRDPSQDRLWFQTRPRGPPRPPDRRRDQPSLRRVDRAVRRGTPRQDHGIPSNGSRPARRTDDLLPEAFAVVKEACTRLCRPHLGRGRQPITWDMVPYDVQLIGGIVLHEGKIAEMATGEGKTLVATLPLYLNALTGQGRPPRHRERLPRPARQRVDGGGLRVPRAHGRVHPEPDGPAAAPPGVRVRHHVRHEQRVRLRLPARQHGGARPSTACSAATTTRSSTRSTRC